MAEGKAHRVAMSGATGFIGSLLRERFEGRGWLVVPVTREALGEGPEGLASRMAGVDAVVNLAGAPILARWTEAYRRELWASRIETTRAMVDAIGKMGDARPGVVVSASAVGIYAAGGPHTEDSNDLAQGFIGELVRAWEAEAMRAEGLGVRVAVMRLGVVLGKGGGAIARMLTPFRLGLGGTVGDGRQAFSWVHARDAARAFEAAVEDTSYRGVYNLTSPRPSTNRELTATLGRVLRRPAVLRVPLFVLRAQFGDGASVLATGQGVAPKRLLGRGFAFEFESLEAALRDCVSEGRG